MVPIKQFNKLPADLKLKYSRKLTNLSLQGTFKPTLNYRWKAKIVDKITLLETPLPVCLTLSLWSAWNLRRILAANFEMQLFFRNNRNFSHVVYENDTALPTARPTPSSNHPPPSLPSAPPLPSQMYPHPSLSPHSSPEIPT